METRLDTTWVTTFDHDFYNWATPHIETFQFPSDSVFWKQILLYYLIQCPAPPGDCDPWDRLGHLRVIEEDAMGAEVHYEIARIITPYDITGGNRPDSCTWVLDVTDYAPILQDSVTLRNYIESWMGNDQGWIVTITLAFIAGTPEFEPYKVINLWTLDRLIYGDPDNDVESHLEPITIDIDAEATAVKLRAITTGHGQGNTNNAAEFAYKWHEVIVGPDVYSHYLWRNDCDENECSPQGGTWQYSRAGWCPGDRVVPWDSDITESIILGAPVEIDYNIQPYVNECRPNNPECVDGVTCADCDYNYTGHTEPFFALNTQLIYYRPPTLGLAGMLNGSNLELHWTICPEAAAYWFYGADNEVYFEPGLMPPYMYRLDVLPSETVNWTSSAGIGDPDNNRTYMVIAVGLLNQEIVRSNRVGEHDFGASIP